MSKIKIDDIRKELESRNWKLISDTYENLNSELIFECEEGHRIYSNWKTIRSKFECPICKQNKYKNNTNEILPKKKNTTRFLGLDQATYKTGFSIFDGKELVKYGIFETTLKDEAARFNMIKMWLISIIENYKPDFVGIEGIQYQQKIGVTVFETLARLQGILIDVLYEYDIPCKICHTAVWRKYCGVKGATRSEKKKSMQFLAKDWYDITVTNDEADAIGIGKYISDNFDLNKVIEWE